MVYPVPEGSEYSRQSAPYRPLISIGVSRPLSVDALVRGPHLSVPVIFRPSYTAKSASLASALFDWFQYRGSLVRRTAYPSLAFPLLMIPSSLVMSRQKP